MQITSIKTQEKSKNRFSIFVDGSYQFSLSDWQLASSGLKIGQAITRQQIDEFKRESGFGKLYERTLDWLAIRPRSRWEIDEYLKRKSDDQEIIDQVIAKIIDLKLIDDTKFAESWVSSRRALKLTSKRRLYQELKQKRVSEEVIQSVLADDETEDVLTIEQVIIKKRRQSRYQDQTKLMAYLARQGFNYTDIKTALAKLEE